MTEVATYRLVHKRARELAISAVARAADGFVVIIKPPTRTLEQNALLHAALSDVAKQMKWHGQRLHLNIWKRLFTAAYLRELNEQPQLVPALDGKGFDVIFERTSKFTVAQMTGLIDWIHAFGAQNGVEFYDAPLRTDHG